MSARDELREYADRYGYTEHVNTLLDAFAAEVRAEVRAEDIALIEDRADDADFTEEPLYIVGLRSAADLLKTSPAAVPVPDETAGDKTPLRGRALLDARAAADAEAAHWRRLGITTCHTNADGHRMVNGHCLYCGKSEAEVA